MQHVWDWFFEIIGPEPLTFTEIANWAMLTGRILRDVEVKALRRLDATRQEWINGRSRPPGA